MCPVHFASHPFHNSLFGSYFYAFEHSYPPVREDLLEFSVIFFFLRKTIFSMFLSLINSYINIFYTELLKINLFYCTSYLLSSTYLLYNRIMENKFILLHNVPVYFIANDISNDVQYLSKYKNVRVNNRKVFRMASLQFQSCM